MAQSFVVQSEKLRDKLNALLPSQNRNSIGVDLSGSTQIIPIIDLTEVAEGSNVRVDLQTALSLTSITAFNVAAATATLVNTTGYYRVFGTMSATFNTSAAKSGNFSLTDGSTTKIITQYIVDSSSGDNFAMTPFDFMVFLPAGHSLTATSNIANLHLVGNTRQIADVTGNLVNPI